MSKTITYYVLVGSHPVDGVFVCGVYTDWHTAMRNLNDQPELRIKSVEMLEEPV